MRVKRRRRDGICSLSKMVVFGISNRATIVLLCALTAIPLLFPLERRDEPNQRGVCMPDNVNGQPNPALPLTASELGRCRMPATNAVQIAFAPLQAENDTCAPPPQAELLSCSSGSYRIQRSKCQVEGLSPKVVQKINIKPNMRSADLFGLF